ncbi:MAG: endonuclease [Bacteroidales bacterium]|nr:endonuclease [Bacteroidales bacterium]
MRKIRPFLLSLLMLTGVFPAFGQHTFTVMTYNIENAFDTLHDEGKNDHEFLMDGNRKWNKSRLFRKLNGLCKIVAAADETKPIDLIGLCEVENDTVMKYLTQRTPLKQMGYQYLITHSNDTRGIDVALLYSPFTFHLINHQGIRPHFPNHPTRDVLHATGTISNRDTLDVYVVHFPSKKGGEAALRRSVEIAQMLQENIDSVCKARKHPNIIVMGDFNAEADAPQLQLLTGENRKKAKLAKGDFPLKNLSEKLKPGTYKYQGEWTTIDHILTLTTTLTHPQAHILDLPFLVEKDPTHGGIKPKRTYLGTIYKGGISDHLPIMAQFQMKTK